MSRPGMKLTVRKVDIWIGAVVALFGAFSLSRALQLAFYAEGVPGPGFFPAVLAILLIVGGLALIVSRFVKPDSESENFDLPSSFQARRSLGVWIALLATVALVNAIGFILAMVLLVAVVLLGIEGRRGVAAIATIILIPLLVYLLFATLLQVPLPTGFGGG
jgi:putative tricarboxylic transport membrane protein